MNYWVINQNSEKVDYLIETYWEIPAFDFINKTTFNATVIYRIADIKLQKRTAQLSIPTARKPLITNSAV